MTAVAFLEWLAGIVGSWLTVWGVVRKVYRPIRRLVTSGHHLLDRIESASTAMEHLNGQLLELSGAVVHYAVARDGQMAELTSRLEDVAEMTVEQGADLARIARQVKELMHT